MLGVLIFFIQYSQPCKVEVDVPPDDSMGSIKDESVMSMKDFVSYMSALEETECDETSQNISELPLDNEEVLPYDSEESSTPIVVNSRKVEEESGSEDTPLVNSIQGSNERPKARKSSLSLSNSFGWHEVIHEEDEVDDDKENFVDKDTENNNVVANNYPEDQKDKSGTINSNDLSKKNEKKLKRPTSISSSFKKSQYSADIKNNNKITARANPINTDTYIKSSNGVKRNNNANKNLNQNQNKTVNSRKPTNLDFVKIRIRPDLKTLPVLQHPETALLASASPSPMTPSDDKVPRLDLDKENNNPTSKETIMDNANAKLQIRESKLPMLTKAILSPTSTPRSTANPKPNNNSQQIQDSVSGAPVGLQRNLTKTVCNKPNADIIKCR